MSIRIGINGFGRIGRIITRIVSEMPDIELRAINSRNANLEYLEYLLRYDTVYGRFKKEISHDSEGLFIDGTHVNVYGYSDALEIPWHENGVDYVIECTGAYVTKETSMDHIKKGVKHVIISAPAKDRETPTFVYGVNHDKYDSSMPVISNASCTTNCLAPLMKIISDNFGIKEGLMSTIHAATAKQKVVDMESLKDWRTGRTVFGNIIPTITGAAKAISLVMPELKDKMTGIAYRVPTADVSVIDVNVVLEKETTEAKLRDAIKKASETYMKDVVEYVDDEVVSGDFIADKHPSIFDSRQTIELNNNFYKLIAFYDNEYGYASNLVNMLKYMYSVDQK